MKIDNIGVIGEDGSYAYKFRNENELKDRQCSLYLYVEEQNGHFYAKFGEAKDSSIWDRYASITGHTAHKRMVCIWKSEASDKNVHTKLREHAKNNVGYVYAGEKDTSALNTEEAYEFFSIDGLNQLISHIKEEVKKKAISKTYTPLYEDIDKLVSEIINTKADMFNLDLCARWGKTRTALELMQRLNTTNKVRISLVMSYVGTVKTSYKNEINSNFAYDNCKFIDPDNYDTPETCVQDIKTWLADPNHYVLYYVALTGAFNDDANIESCFKRRTMPLEGIGHDSMMFVEEADFGSACDKQIKKIQNLFSSLNCKKFFAMTGTNAEKSELIWPDKHLEYFKKDYLIDVLTSTCRPNAVPIHWHVLSNAGLCENIPGYKPAMMENFSDMLQVMNDGHLKEETYFEFLIAWLFLKNGLNPVKCREIIKSHPMNLSYATVIFMPPGNAAHLAMKALIERTLGKDWLVKIIDGDETTNAKAESLARNAIKDHGNKTIFIASGMANRSFSVPEIKNVILLFNDGSYSSITQKIARGLTPFKDSVIPCNVIDFRMNYSSNVEKYLEAIGKDAIDDEVHTTENDEVELLKKICATGKILFNEYYFNGIDPIKKLSVEDLHTMMQTTSFYERKSEIIICKRLDEIDTPKQCLIPKDIIKKSKQFECNNIKGDSDKYEKTFNAMSKKKKAEKTSIEEKKDFDDKLLHFKFLWNHRDYFNTYQYSTMFEEFDAIDESQCHCYEDELGIDMNVMRQILLMLKKHNVKMDFEY